MKMKQIKGKDKDWINVEEIELCGICNKPIKQNQRRISLTVYDEVKRNNELFVNNAWNIASYHKKCSPIKINKGIFKK